jgi:hypothetical protein
LKENIIIILNGLIEPVGQILFANEHFISYFYAEDVILNEERTTEQERRAIHEGKL